MRLVQYELPAVIAVHAGERRDPIDRERDTPDSPLRFIPTRCETCGFEYASHVYRWPCPICEPDADEWTTTHRELEERHRYLAFCERMTAFAFHEKQGGRSVRMREASHTVRRASDDQERAVAPQSRGGARGNLSGQTHRGDEPPKPGGAFCADGPQFPPAQRETHTARDGPDDTTGARALASGR